MMRSILSSLAVLALASTACKRDRQTADRLMDRTTVGQNRCDEVEPTDQLIFASDGTLLLRLNPVTLERTPRSVDYEGFYFGIAFGF